MVVSYSCNFSNIRSDIFYVQNHFQFVSFFYTSTLVMEPLLPIFNDGWIFSNCTLYTQLSFFKCLMTFVEIIFINGFQLRFRELRRQLRWPRNRFFSSSDSGAWSGKTRSWRRGSRRPSMSWTRKRIGNSVGWRLQLSAKLRNPVAHHQCISTRPPMRKVRNIKTGLIVVLTQA